MEEDCRKGGRCSRCHSFSSRLEESRVLLENGDVLSLEHPQRVRIGCLLFTLPSVINGCSLSTEGAVLASSCAVYSTALAPSVRWFSLQNGHAKRFRLNTGLACLGGCAQEKKCSSGFTLLCMHFVRAGNKYGHEPHRKKLRERKTAQFGGWRFELWLAVCIFFFSIPVMGLKTVGVFGCCCQETAKKRSIHLSYHFLHSILCTICCSFQFFFHIMTIYN